VAILSARPTGGSLSTSFLHTDWNAVGSPNSRPITQLIMTLHRAHHWAACELKAAQDKYKDALLIGRLTFPSPFPPSILLSRRCLTRTEHNPHSNGHPLHPTYIAQAPVHSSPVRGAGSCYVVAAARITVREETFGDGLSPAPHRIPHHPLHRKSRIFTVPTCIFLRHPRLAVHITSFPSHHPVRLSHRNYRDCH
jgi:hypothetical protein